MTKTAKRILFYTALIVFLGISYIAVLYAQGYKFNFSQNRFLKTGALYLKVNTDAGIYIDDVLVGQTSLLMNSFTKNGLMPGQYLLKVQRDGFSVWQKKAIIEEGLVTDFSRIVILPETGLDESAVKKEIDDIFLAKTASKKTSSPLSPSPTPIPAGTFSLSNKNLYQNIDNSRKLVATGVKGYAFSDDQAKISWWNDNELWILWLKNSDYQPFMKKGDQELVTRFATPIKNVAWFRDQDHLVVDSGGYKVVEIDSRGGVNIIRI